MLPTRACSATTLRSPAPCPCMHSLTRSRMSSWWSCSSCPTYRPCTCTSAQCQVMHHPRDWCHHCHSLPATVVVDNQSQGPRLLLVQRWTSTLHDHSLHLLSVCAGCGYEGRRRPPPRLALPPSLTSLTWDNAPSENAGRWVYVNMMPGIKEFNSTGE
jgi:hypothetical protein